MNRLLTNNSYDYEQPDFGNAFLDFVENVFSTFSELFPQGPVNPICKLVTEVFAPYHQPPASQLQAENRKS